MPWYQVVPRRSYGNRRAGTVFHTPKPIENPNVFEIISPSGPQSIQIETETPKDEAQLEALLKLPRLSPRVAVELRTLKIFSRSDLRDQIRKDPVALERVSGISNKTVQLWRGILDA